MHRHLLPAQIGVSECRRNIGYGCRFEIITQVIIRGDALKKSQPKGEKTGIGWRNHQLVPAQALLSGHISVQDQGVLRKPIKGNLPDLRSSK